MASTNELKNILNNLEIPDLQAQVYLGLLELGEANFTEIAKKTGIKRTTMYAIMEKMEEKGLVQKSLDKKTFQPIHPGKIFEKMQTSNLIFHHALPQFQAIMKQPEKITKVKFYKGTKGIQQLFLDELTSYKTKEKKIIRIIAGASFHAQDPEFKEEYADKKYEAGVVSRIIASHDLKEYINKYKKLYSVLDVKLLPESLGKITGRIAAGPSSITLIGFLKDQSGITIESQELADTFIKFFDFVWDLMKK